MITKKDWLIKTNPEKNIPNEIISKRKEKAMTQEQLLSALDRKRSLYDRRFDLGDCEAETRCVVDDKPEELDVDFYISYYGKKLSLCTTEKLEGEEKALKEAKESKKFYFEDLIKMKKRDPYYKEWLARYWASKDYIDGEV